MFLIGGGSCCGGYNGNEEVDLATLEFGVRGDHDDGGAVGGGGDGGGGVGGVGAGGGGFLKDVFGVGF